MQQLLRQAAPATLKARMKKSEIVLAVMSRRTGLPPTDKKLHRDFHFALERRSVRLAEWDGEVDAELAPAIIKHVASVQGSLTLHEAIADVDIILKRIA